MKRILFLLLLTVSVYGQNPSRFVKIQITGNTNSATATKVNVQEANGEVNTQTINTGFNKNIGLGGSDVVGANTLLNQYSTTPIDWTATAFNSGQVVFYGGKQWIAKIATVAGDVPAASSKWEEITFDALSNKTVIVDATPTDGSNNAVSSNGVFDALATKAPISSVHNPVTLGTANGLSLANQQLSLGLASSSTTGALSGTDWNTFNGKFNTPTGLTTNYLPKWNGSGFGNSQIFDGGSNIGVGTNNIAYSKFTIKQTEIDKSALLLETIQGGRAFEVGGYGNFLVNKVGVAGGRFQILENGRILINKTDDDLTNQLQVAGTISASPATTANQVVVKSQLDAVAGVSGTYTPSLTNVVNVSGLSLTSLATYSKIGKIVTLTISANFGSGGTSDTICTFDVSLPSSKNAGGNQYIGTGSVLTGTNDIMPLFAALQTSSTVRCAFKHTSNASGKININIQYQEN